MLFNIDAQVIKAASLFTHRGDECSSLRLVELKTDGSDWQIAATDNYCLFVAKSGHVDEDSAKVYLFDPNLLAVNIKRKHRTIAFNDKGDHLEASIFNNRLVRDCPLLIVPLEDVRYPNWERLIPASCDIEKGMSKVNGKFLERVCKASSILTKTPNIEIETFGKNRNWITLNSHETYDANVVLMGCSDE